MELNAVERVNRYAASGELLELSGYAYAFEPTPYFISLLRVIDKRIRIPYNNVRNLILTRSSYGNCKSHFQGTDHNP
jgi:hypothetical protein